MTKHNFLDITKKKNKIKKNLFPKIRD